MAQTVVFSIIKHSMAIHPTTTPGDLGVRLTLSTLSPTNLYTVTRNN